MDVNAVDVFKEKNNVVIETKNISMAKNILMDEYQELFKKISGGELAEKIRETYQVTLEIGSLGSYQQILDSCDIRCTNYVRISPETLAGMEKNPALKKKVLNEIAEFCSSKEQAEIKGLQPPVKSAGMLVYPDGSTLYWLEGYPNEPEDGEEKKRIVTGQCVNELCQSYRDLDEESEENNLKIAMQIMAAGRRVQEKRKGSL